MILIINIVIFNNGSYTGSDKEDENWTCTGFTAVWYKGTEFLFIFSYFCLSFSSSSFVEVGEVIYFEASLEGWGCSSVFYLWQLW